MSPPLSAAKHDSYADGAIRDILRSVRTVAIVGASDNPTRPSFLVAKYLVDRGYDVVPVNPRLAGKVVAGVAAVASLTEIGRAIDMVDIFRTSDAAGGATDDALALDPLPKVIWMQLGVRNDAAAIRAEARGVTVIMNRCPKIEYARFSGEIGWQGINSRIVSSKRPVRAIGGVQKLTLDRRI